jgi:hypothetical protein
MSMDKCVQMGCDNVMLIFYESKVNIFYDRDGHEIHYLYELLTPNDIMLFKKDNGNNIFVSRENRRTMIEILADYV